jgi:hypothetical protein
LVGLKNRRLVPALRNPCEVLVGDVQLIKACELHKVLDLVV